MMGRYLFRLPDIGEGVAEAEIVVWHVQAGDVVREDQTLVDVMTDKATVDMTSPVDGVVVAIHGEIGAMARVGSVLVELEVAGAGHAGDEVKVAPAQAAPLAAPATRRRALELGIALQDVAGTGRNGRITTEDIDAFVAARGQVDASPAMDNGVDDLRIVGLRRKIAEKMQEAARRIPHFAYVEECDLTELEALRAEMNASRFDGQPKLTLLPFLMRALVRVLPEFPQINAHYDDDEGMLHRYRAVHIGIATQTASGLMVPVVRHAESRGIWDCARELARVSGAAKAGTAAREELSGSTITLSSLGTLGGVVSTPIINHPEVAIIAPNRLVERPVVKDGLILVRKMMNLSSSFDHRIVDGYDAALFVQRVKRMLEHPALMFMDEDLGLRPAGAAPV